MMQRSPLGYPLGLCLAKSMNMRLVIKSVEGAECIQDIMERCSSHESSERPKAEEVLRDLQNAEALLSRQVNFSRSHSLEQRQVRSPGYG